MLVLGNLCVNIMNNLVVNVCGDSTLDRVRSYTELLQQKNAILVPLDLILYHKNFSIFNCSIQLHRDVIQGCIAAT